MRTKGSTGPKAPSRAGTFAPESGATMAFSRPGGEASGRSRSRSRLLDLEYLSRQTMGDRVLEQEVLALFSHHIGTIRDGIATADETERRRLAHTLKGAARGVGAFTLADCAERIEADPFDRANLSRLGALIGEVRDFIAAISR